MLIHSEISKAINIRGLKNVSYHKEKLTYIVPKGYDHISLSIFYTGQRDMYYYQFMYNSKSTTFVSNECTHPSEIYLFDSGYNRRVFNSICDKFDIYPDPDITLQKFLHILLNIRNITIDKILNNE